MHKKKVIDLQNYREGDEDAPESVASPEAEYLRPGTALLFGQYTIAGYLACGGFGITYLAQDSLGRKVAVKECFPGELCYRSGNEMRPQRPAFKAELEEIVDYFIKEAQRLASLKHDNIVHVHQIFEENATAYMVMDFIDGPDLLDIAEGHAPVPAPTDIEEMTVKLLRAIAFVHERGFLHRDISPDNILIGPEREPVLIDFGSARQASDQTPRRPSRLKFVKDGYSPQEFYIPGREQGPWSDLYSFAASLHHVIVGSAPEDGQTRLAALAAKEPDPYQPLAGRIEHFSTRYLKAIDKALEVLPANRIQSAADWLTYLGETVEAPEPRTAKTVSLAQRSVILTAPLETVSATLAKTGENRRLFLMGGAAAAIVAVIGLAAYGFGGQGNVSDAEDVVSTGGAPAEAVPTLSPTETTPESDLALPAAPAELRSLDSIVEAVVLPDVESESPAESVIAPQPTQDVSETTSLAVPLSEPNVPDVAAVETALRIDAPSALPVQPAVPAEAPKVTGELLQTGFDAPKVEALGASLAAVSPVADWTAIQGLPETLVEQPVEAPTSLPGVPVVTFISAEPVSFLPETVQIAALDLTPEIEVLAIRDLSVLPTVFGDVAFSGDVTPPEFVPTLAPIADTQVTFSHWDVDMPFESTMDQVRSANTVTIAEVSEDADLAVSGRWIKKDAVIYAFNGARLEPGVPLSGHVLNALNVDPDGYVRATVRYRDPDTGTIDRGLLAVPVVRAIGLADGSLLEARMVDLSWQISVVEAADGSGLQTGDVVVREGVTGTVFADPEDIATALDQLVGRGDVEARFVVLRDEAEQQVTWQLSRNSN